MNKKNKNKKGFSLAISMLFLLIVIMLTLVLTTAALNASRQVEKRISMQQENLNVTSISDAIAKDLKGMVFSVKEITPLGSSEVTIDSIDVYDSHGNTALANSVRDWMNSAISSSSKKCETSGLSLVFKSDASTEVLADITVYAIDSEVFPGDIVVSILSKNIDSAIRIDGQYDNASKRYYFRDVTHYSGSGVYGQ